MVNFNVSDDAFNPYIIMDTPAPSPDDTICLSLENTIRAQCSLSPLAFFFYMVFVISKNQSSFLFPSVEFCEATGLPYEIYMDAFTELLNDHYLTPADIDPKIFYFHDGPLVPSFALHPDASDPDPWSDDTW